MLHRDQSNWEDQVDSSVRLDPMWETQVRLERGMLREGADRFRSQVATAIEREQMSRLQPIMGLLSGKSSVLPLVAKGLRDWINLWRRPGRPGKTVPIALQPLEELDPYVSCLIALRAVLDSFSAKAVAVTGLASAIGRTIEHELQVRKWEALEPKLFHAQQKELRNNRSTSAHIQRVNINRFNALLDKGLFGFEWTRWPEAKHFHVGMALLQNLMRVTMWFEMRSDPDAIFASNKSPQIVLIPKPHMLEWLGRQFDRYEWAAPAFKPTVVRPKRWNGTRSGGYHTPYVNTPRLIRFKTSQVQQQERAADDYDAIDMPEVYEAVHFLQEVPWRVNKRVYEVAKEAMARSSRSDDFPALPGLPVVKLRKQPEFPPGYMSEEEVEGERIHHRDGTSYRTGNVLEPQKDAYLRQSLGGPKAPKKIDRWAKVAPLALKRWKRAAAAVYRHNVSSVSSVENASRTMRVALEYAEYEHFYFPHTLDFRGRAYPIPVGLQPQGDDLARGLLEFAEGKPIDGYEALGWLQIQLASMWGGGSDDGNSWDKLPNEDRIQKVEDGEELWRRIAADPLGNLEWTKADEPWQVLAAIFDYVAALDYGHGYISHLVVSVDGTCNGLQHLSAMTRDSVAGALVNLTPGAEPKDIYKHVAKLLQDVLQETLQVRGPDGEHARYWLELCNWDLPRTLTKRQVMVLPYGATRSAFGEYTIEWLDKHDPIPDDPPEGYWEQRFARINFLVTRMWLVVGQVLPGAMSVMAWLRACAKIVSKGNQPIMWLTPSGFVVRHFYGALKKRLVETKIDSQRLVLQLPVTTKDLDVTAQLLGIAPNFVHSQDAAAMVRAVILAKADGVTAFTSVHDAFGTHAADMTRLADHLRLAFVQVHEADPLVKFRNVCIGVMVAEMVTRLDIDPFEAAQKADDLLPQPPALGTLDINQVLESDYFFS